MRDQAVSSPSLRIPAVPGVAVALAGLSLLFALASPGFLTAGNLSNVLVQSVILLLLALPMTLIIMTEGLDLSMGAVLTLASLVLANLTTVVSFGLIAQSSIPALSAIGQVVAPGALLALLLSAAGLPRRTVAPD